jgi:hypothetical protein
MLRTLRRTRWNFCLLPGSHGEFENHVVARIAKPWAPEEEDRLLMSDGTEVVQHIANVAAGQP